MRHSIQFGSRTISFQLFYLVRKSLGITVTPEMEVIVKAPTYASLEKVKEKVRKRAPWIIKQQSFFLSFHPKASAKRYVTGESHLYLGRQYQLKVRKSKKNAVSYKGRFLEIQSVDKKKAKSLLKKWCREKAKEKFAEIAKPIIERFKKYDVAPKGIFIQQMETRWGSCTPKGRIILNPELIKAPKACIEYVIVHELCHLVYPNHTRQFYNLQTKEMKDWNKWKDKLEKLLA